MENNTKPCVKKLAEKHKKFQIIKKKRFENQQLGIISQKLNNSNPTHI